MSLPTKEDLKTLSQQQASPLVSIYMPTRPMGPETRENWIRLKNLLAEAETQLLELGIRMPEIRALLEPAQNLIIDNDFWQHQSTGLALFLAPEFHHIYRVPLDFEELVVVGDRFHLKQLMPLLRGGTRFYLLALSQNQVKLFQGTETGLDEVELENVPQSLADALWYEDPEKQQQFHTATATPSGRGGRPAMFHGHGTGVDDERESIRQYFQKIDKGLSDLLRNQQAPLVLAGVEYLLPIFREVSGYRYLLSEGITGNPENMQNQELRQRAWKILQAYFDQAQQQAFAKYQDLINTTQTSQDIKEIVPAASYAQVDTLFVAVNQHRWGRFDPDRNSLTLEVEAKPENEDLLDLAAIQTLLNGGTVYAVEPEQMPDGALLAAIFRFEK